MLKKEQGVGEWFSGVSGMNKLGELFSGNKSSLGSYDKSIGEIIDPFTKKAQDYAGYKNDFLNKSPMGYKPDFNLNSNKFDFGKRKPLTFNGGF